ncbi:hypothetical protein ACFL4F_03075 [Candidatus Margulisiibacteriota bacterium]
MEPGIIMTLMICGTILLVVIIGLLFTAWVITKGIQVSRENK